MRPRLLDLFCGAGGAAMGYHRAGFDVVGVDIAPQPNYPFEFHQADALEYLAAHGHEFDAIHASPPCQRYSTATADPSRHPDLIAPVRSALLRLRKPYAIENVPGAPLDDPVRLCGSSFSLGVRRHRNFEANFDIPALDCNHRAQGTPLGVYGQHPDRMQHWRPSGQSRGIKARTLYEGQWAMGGIHWMTWPELAESIPPAYTEHVGRQLLHHIETMPLTREDQRMTITPETIAELRRVSDLFNEGKMAIPLGPVFHHLPALLDAAERLAEVTAERDALAASVARVREGHTPHPDYLPGPNGVPIRWERCQGCNGAYPCQPIRALDGSGS